MLDRIFLAALFNGAMVFSIASAGDCCGNGHHNNGCVSCPSCHKVCCQLNAEPSEEEKSCWKVECEQICVPRVVFPWQNRHHRKGHGHGHGSSSCDSCCSDGCCGDGCCGGVTCCDACACNNGAYVKTIKVLKKHKYTCPSCEYSWTPVNVVCGDGTGCCCNGGCDASVELNTVPEVQLDDDVPAPPEPTAGKVPAGGNQMVKKSKIGLNKRTKALQAALKAWSK